MEEFDRVQRRRERQKRRRRRIWKRRVLVLLLVLLAAGAAVLLLTGRDGGGDEGAPAVEPSPSSSPAAVAAGNPSPFPEPVYAFHATETTVNIPNDFPSGYAVLIDVDSGAILARRNSDVPVNPASMTKILTLLVAAEHIEDHSGTWTMTREVADYCFSNQCSVVGLEVGEAVPVEELFYGCITNSGADASLGLAELAAGSHEAFVALMNEKLAELGLSDTAHFTNCVGLFDDGHHCTMEDMAYILKAALENEFCRQVLTTKLVLSAPTEQHPDGQALSNWFIRRIEEEDTGRVTVLTGKTGWVEESGYCAASYGEDGDGKGYLCVTGASTSTWQSIYDHAELYRTYCP